MNSRKNKPILRTLCVASIATAAAFAVVWSASNEVVPSTERTSAGLPLAGKATVGKLRATYEKWSAAYGQSDPRGPVVALSYNRGLSTEYSAAKGIAQLDLEAGHVSVRVTGLADQAIADVWLVDNQPGEGRSVLPEEGDVLIKIGRLEFDAQGDAWLDAEVEELSTLRLDSVVIARVGQSPGSAGILYGTTSLFQKIFHYPDTTSSEGSQHTRAPRLADLLVPEAHATGFTPDGFFDDIEGLDADTVNEGRRLFFEETFDGNGRTCGTCHREEDNLALGLRTIASLPDSDPLFIVEQEFRADGSPNPLFNEFRMERPALMRKLGLILENLNGFERRNGEIHRRASMRAPNHVLSMRTTLAPPPALANDDGTLPVGSADLVFAERTGWSGDGTPTGFREDFFEARGRELTGSLRDFTIGAIVQHFTLTLERSALTTGGRQPDFRFATEAELDAMEAFMLSSGRQEENQPLEDIQLVDELANRGRLNYLGFNVFDATPNDGRPPLNCQACHLDGGANTNPVFPFPSSVTPNHDLADLAASGGSIPSHNRSFGPGVERLADQAGDVFVQVVDDPSVRGNCFRRGFAEVPLLPGDQPGVPSLGCNANPFDNGFLHGVGDRFGNRGERAATNRFNAPPVFEAMDNPPFFHGHQVNTIEAMVAFYATNRHFRNGDFAGAIVPLNASQVANVARFLRVMGADFNLESAITLLEKTLGFRSNENAVRRHNVSLALAEITDAVQLLDGADIHFSDVVPLLEETSGELTRPNGVPRTGNTRLAAALVNLGAAQAMMINRAPN